MAMCKECAARFSTDVSGLCRFCKRAKERTAVVAASIRVYEALEREPEPERRPLRTVVYDGQAYDVMWDGAVGAELR